MAYKWKPSKSQKRAFAQKMQNEEGFAEAYYQRKEEKRQNNIKNSRFDYPSAGGRYHPTGAQNDYAVFDRSMNTTPEHDEACDIVAGAYACKEKVHHDYIHIVNELIRMKENKNL